MGGRVVMGAHWGLACGRTGERGRGWVWMREKGEGGLKRACAALAVVGRFPGGAAWRSSRPVLWGVGEIVGGEVVGDGLGVEFVGDADGFGDAVHGVEGVWGEADGGGDESDFWIEAFEKEVEVAVVELAAEDAAVVEAGLEGDAYGFGLAGDFHGGAMMSVVGAGGKKKTNVA